MFKKNDVVRSDKDLDSLYIPKDALFLVTKDQSEFGTIVKLKPLSKPLKDTSKLRADGTVDYLARYFTKV